MEYQGTPRSFAVEYAALGFLIKAPMHGYDLRDRLGQGLGSLWRIASSQLYNVLHRLEKKQWIACRVEPQSGRPSRNVYQITEAGERAFWTWATSAVGHLRDVRVELLAKVYFLRRLAPEKVATLVDLETETLRLLLGRLKEKEGIESDDEAFGSLALAFRVSQVGGAIRWLEENRDQLASVKGET